MSSRTNPPKLETYLHHLVQVKDLCHEFSKSMGRRSSQYSPIWAAALFLRSIVCLNATILLIKSTFYDDAAILIRTLFEVELQLGAIKAEPEIAKRLLDTVDKFREKRLKAIHERGQELPGGLTQGEVAKEIAEINAKKISPEIPKRQLAIKSQDAGLLYAYDTIYSLLSDVAHVSPMGLANYFEKNASTGILKLNPNSNLFSPHYLAVLAAATQLNIFDLTTSLLGDSSATADDLHKQNGIFLAEIRDAGEI